MLPSSLRMLVAEEVNVSKQRNNGLIYKISSMTSIYIKNFSYSIFLNFLLLVLVLTTVSNQGKYVKNFQQFENYLIIKRIISLDTLFQFDGVKGVLPKQQKRRVYRLEFIKGKFVSITIPVIPVNTKFVESNLLPPIHGLIFKCTCDSNNNSANTENEKFLTYKVIVLPRSTDNNDILSNGFKLFITNTELTNEKNTKEPCLKAGSAQYYLEGDYWNDYPYPKIDSNWINQKLVRIKKINGGDKLSNEEFYFNTLKDKDLIVKIPILEIALDTKKSRNIVVLISLCFSAFGLNMFRMARISFKKDKGIEPFFLHSVSRDLIRTIKVFSRIKIFRIRIDSFLFLIYHFISFLTPLLILFVTSRPRYEGESSSRDNGVYLILLVASMYFVTSFFYNYVRLFTNKAGYKVFKDVINLFKEEPDILLEKLKTPFSLKKWVRKILSLIDKGSFKDVNLK